MLKGVLTIVISASILLSGCASINNKETAIEPQQDRPAAAPVDMGVDWEYRVVGDMAVRPVQVFSINDETYLQMKDGDPVVLMVAGEPVPFIPRAPYLVITGLPKRIDIVANGYRAIVEHVAKQATQEQIEADYSANTSRRVERVNLQ
jgi:hypothetical protein